jgi:hypothetical protein
MAIARRAVCIGNRGGASELSTPRFTHSPAIWGEAQVYALAAMSPKVRHEDIPLDLSRYARADQALQEAQGYADQFIAIARRAMEEENPKRLFGMTQMFLCSALARASGLHDGITREIKARNPHAVFSLLRTYVELSGILAYVQDKPDYIDRLTGRQASNAGRVSFEKIWSAISTRYPGIKRVYSELSEFGHFGSTGVWASWTPLEGEGEGKVHWRLGPGWRDEERDPLLAAAQLAEIDHVVHDEANAIVETIILPVVKEWTAKGLDVREA